MNTQEYLGEIKQRLNKATPGPWFMSWFGRSIIQSKIGGANPYYENLNICKIPMRTDKYPISHVEYVANGELIAHSRTDVEKLTRMLERALVALNQIKKAAVKGDETTTELECHGLADDAIADIEAIARGEDV